MSDLISFITLNRLCMRKLVCILSLFLSITSYSFSQSPEKLLTVYNERFPQEKVYLHFDNDAYTPGALVGFKAYLMSGPDLSRLNRNFYTDWYDESGKLLSHQVSPIAMSSAFGTFLVPENYKGNTIHVVAYTQWMLNFDSSFLFRKKIRVLQSSDKVLQAPVKTREYGLQFFPEGGVMVNGITSFVALKATDKNGDPIHVQGVIKNDQGAFINRFRSLHDGMGKFAFIPEAGVTYFAEWLAPDSSLQQTPLPVSVTDGITMQVSTSGDTRYMQVQRSETLAPHLRKLTMLLAVNQQVVLRGTVNLENETATQVKIPVKGLPSGPATITLMNGMGDPVCERLIFINNYEYRSAATIRLDTIGLSKRAKNVFEIELPDTIPANLSLAITNHDLPDDSSNNIISSLLLSSEVKGKIHNPAFYFREQQDSAKHYLDLVMLTNGWRKFVWKKVMDSTSWVTRYPMDTTYLSLTGKIDGFSENRLAKAETLNLILRGKDSSSLMRFTPIGKSGSIYEPNVIFFDTVKLYYQLNKISVLPGRGKVTINTNLIDTAYYKSIQPTTAFRYDTAEIRMMREIALQQIQLQKLREGTTLEEVVVKTRAKSRLEELDDTYANGMFRNVDALSFDMINDPRALSSFSVFDYLQGRVPGMQVIGALTSNPNIIWRNGTVGFFLNEMPIEPQFAATIPMTDVAYLKVFRPPFIGSLVNAGGGAVAIYTKKGADLTNSIKGLDNLSLVGYAPIREFYQPDYAVDQQNFSKTDTRRTLYWNPNLITRGTDTKIRVVFYNNDISSKLKIVLEGVNNNDQFISVRKLLE
jgi:hypothetical protein